MNDYFQYYTEIGPATIPVFIRIYGINLYRHTPDNKLRIEYDHYEVWTDEKEPVEIPEHLIYFIWGNDIEKKVDSLLSGILEKAR